MMKIMWFLILAAHLVISSALKPEMVSLASDYFIYKNVKYLNYLSCENQYQNKMLVGSFINNGIRASVKDMDKINEENLEKMLYYWKVAIGVLIDGSCIEAERVLLVASERVLLDAMHVWLVIANVSSGGNVTQYIEETFQQLNLSADADVAVVSDNGPDYTIVDVYNFGKIQGNPLETEYMGSWNNVTGLNITLDGFKYYNRWDFHNLTLRAVSVILDRPKVFYPEMLSEPGFTQGVSAMTKVVTQLLNVLMTEHNFRFNYTIAGRWIGSPARNSTLAVTNSLYWKEQDISCTCARIFPKWLEWVDIFFPPATKLETRFFYLIPDKGVGDYENRFLAPMSTNVWWCGTAVGIVCIMVLSGAAILERRPSPALYALFSVIAAICQQAYEDGIQILDNVLSGQGRRFTLLVVGLTSMLFYNYYTSSVVSWLLSSAPPTIVSLDELINSDLELVFEDIGYTRGWLDNPNFFYYSGFKNIKEDELRIKKVQNGKHTAKLLQPANDGITLIRKGGYAYHTEPYTASQEISRTFNDREICDLGSLQMMMPASVYIMAQKRSPYKEFFNWSLMRLLERGHMKASRARVGGNLPVCSGSTPRALALGQAAPAFIILIEAALLASLMLLMEILWRRYEHKNRF